jgi:hypothetical protein
MFAYLLRQPGKLFPVDHFPEVSPNGFASPPFGEFAFFESSATNLISTSKVIMPSVQHHIA